MHQLKPQDPRTQRHSSGFLATCYTVSQHQVSLALAVLEVLLFLSSQPHPKAVQQLGHGVVAGGGGRRNPQRPWGEAKL